MEPANPIRVLCVDDHPLMRAGIIATLEGVPGIQIVAEAADGSGAIAAYREHRPDVTLMDLQMTGMNGIEAIQRIRSEFPNARVIVLTTYDGDVQVKRALKAGALGYLLKNTLRQDLIQAIRSAHKGKRTIPAEVAAQLSGYIDADALSPREVEVLDTISQGNSNKIVAAKLAITEDTVKGHVSSIMSKLHANDRTHSVLIALRRGFLDAWRSRDN
ncbi:MAG TPA: response regulator transcription factor [Acidobacteriaceae bacterium]|jgi:DNA-binding NarL/FixJ family response regulator|nr:response regulator transcription factor [Acidobacteriaceae bacterium]